MRCRGAGRCGCVATLAMAEPGLKTACSPKSFPDPFRTTVAAQGASQVPCPNMGPDNWQWHMYDTVKGFGLVWRHGCDANPRARSPQGPVVSLSTTRVPFAADRKR